MMAQADSGELEFEGFRLHLVRRQLFAPDGAEIDLKPKVFDTLATLATRPGQLLRKSELMDAVWPGIVVEENNLNQAISALRKALGPAAKKLIATIPGRGYQFAAAVRIGGGLDATPSPVAAGPAEPVLAVLPFDNLSPDADLAFFSDGMSDEILQAVSRALKTIGRTSSFRFRGADKAAPGVAVELGATHILDGSVRRGEGLVRINAHLIEAATQTTIWQEQFDRPLADLFAVQDEVAVAVAGALDRRLSPARGQVDIDPEVYQLYLRLRHMALRHAGSVDQTLISTADQLTSRAPTFGLGWIESARLRVRARQHLSTGSAEARSYHDHAIGAAARAAQLLGSDHPAVTALTVNMQPWCGAWTACEKRLRDSLESWPYESQVMLPLADLLMHAGRGSEAVVLTREIYEREPFEARYAVVHGFALNVLGRHQEELAVLEAACRRWPDSPWTWRMLVTSAAQTGRWDIVDRWTAPDRLSGLPPHSTIIRTANARLALYRNADSKARGKVFHTLAESVKRTGRLDLPEMAFASQFCELDIVYGLVEQASFSHLFDPAGFGSSDSVALFLAYAKSLRSDPRFLRLCARLGLVTHWIESGRWPDCADQTPYDFRAEARRSASTPLG